MRPQLEQVNAPEDLLDDVWLTELSQLMPELRARYPDLPPPMTGDPQFVRARLFEALALLSSALAARGPAIFVLDDLQWADADTLDLVHYLARRWTETGTPIMLLLTVRQEAYAADAALREWLTILERDTFLTRLLLDNLGGAAVGQLVSTLAGEGAAEKATSAFAAWLWAETQGLPFFIKALLPMLVEQELLTASDETRSSYNFAAALAHVRSVARVPLPPGVREVIRARLAQHSKGANSLLLAAAVLGRACTFERLCQVADLAETEALEALEVLLDGRLLTERSADRRPYMMAHDYIREVVYTESREARRRVFHRRALLALEAAGAPAAECAFHALASLLDEPAFRYSGVFKPLKAKELGQSALALAQELGDEAAQAGALWGVAVAELYSSGDINQVMAYGQQALALARELGLKELMGRILINLCWPLIAQKQLDQAREALSGAQVIWRELGNLPRLGEATRFMLIMHFVAGDQRCTLAEAPEVRELGASIGSGQDEVEPLLYLEFAHSRQGRFGLALDCLEKLGSYAEALGHLNENHGHQWGRIKFYLAVGALEDAERWADRLYAERETIMPNFTTVCLTDVARAKIACGKLDEDRTILDGMLSDLPYDAIWSHNIILMAIAYGELHLALGQPEALFFGLEARVRPYRDAGFLYLLADELWLRGRAELAMDQYDAARATLLEARATAEAQEERAILWKILATSSELERACCDEAAAEKLRDQARAVVTDIAEHAGKLRGAFLDQPAVARLPDSRRYR